MLRKILLLVLVNSAVIMTFAAIAVAKPNYIRAGALLMPLLFVFNFFYFHGLQRSQAKALAAGIATPLSPVTRRLLMWFLGIYGVVSYISAASNLPMLFAQRDFGPWLGWSVKVAMGTLCIWLALRIRSSLKAVNLDSDPPQ